MITLALRTRKLRVIYEEKVRDILESLNSSMKGKGLRWKIGQFFTWIELSLDYKVESAMIPTGHSKGFGFDTLLIPQKMVSSKNFI
jgi:hypothetical protein